MARTLADYGTFFREFRRNFHTTGSILPSSGYLATALAKPVKNRAEGDKGPRKILEVGPGSGAVTEKILAALGPEDHLDLVEINEDFVTLLHRRLAEEPAWQAVAERVQVKHQRIEELVGETPYDVIISGLPLNNFSVAAVDQILTTLSQLARPGGQLSFFEYIYIRNLRSLVSNRDDRTRLRGITGLLYKLFQHEQRRDSVWLNFPPAWVHHVVYPAKTEHEESPT